MVTITVVLDKRRVKNDGTYPLNFRIYHQGKASTRSTRITIAERYWDEKKKQIKNTHPTAGLLNTRLRKDLADLQSKLILADDEQIQQYLAPKQIIPVAPTVQKVPVYSFAYELIKELKLDNKIGNAWVYEATVNALKGFHPDEELYFEQIDYKFLDSYNKFLLRRGIKQNSAFLYIRTLRAFYNKAIKHKIVDRNLYPFYDFSIKGEKTKKRAVDKQVITEMMKIDLPEGSTIWHVRNWFMLSFYFIGISFVDLALLTNKNVKGDRLTYKRQKTGKQYDIKLLPQARMILRHYSNNSSGHLLPIINRKTESVTERLRLIKDRNRLANKYLSRVADLIKAESITTYTARHSWATICKKLGISNELIAECMGHEFGNKTTAIYLDSFDQEVLDEVNIKVARSVKYRIELSHLLSRRIGS
ncbi:site-specific integrase [Pedobacter psychroterrae]|uniref:Site-specific recombinase XerD n=1 Tax=Pedobacter psychroterrae TaxID=2530453 RepID=A0A4V2MKF8_9SPHI|nr:site-specific integrase [Pedobacter psychroterrae]TCC98046.1 hypothetical protein EZ437_19570 [Pedobacter psychroterrae]